MQEEIKEILDNFEKYEARYRLHDETQFIITHREIQILLDYITNSQEENEYFNHCDEEKRKTITNLRYKIERLEEENTKLKELCDKYEEEHSTTFEEWKKDINIIDELKKTLKEEVKGLYNEENPMLLDETYIKYATERKIAYMYVLDKLNELRGDNK